MYTDKCVIIRYSLSLICISRDIRLVYVIVCFKYSPVTISQLVYHITSPMVTLHWYTLDFPPLKWVLFTLPLFIVLVYVYSMYIDIYWGMIF